MVALFYPGLQQWRATNHCDVLSLTSHQCTKGLHDAILWAICNHLNNCSNVFLRASTPWLMTVLFYITTWNKHMQWTCSKRRRSPLQVYCTEQIWKTTWLFKLELSSAHNMLKMGLFYKTKQWMKMKVHKQGGSQARDRVYTDQTRRPAVSTKLLEEKANSRRPHNAAQPGCTAEICLVNTGKIAQ